MGASAPPPPDYRGAAEQQGQSSVANTQQQTWANRPNQTTPWGSTTWQAYDTGQRDAAGNPITGWNQQTTLDPFLQQALDAQIGLQTQRSQFGAGMFDRVAGELGQGMDWSNLPQAGGRVSPYQLQMGLDTSGVPAMGQAPGSRQLQSQLDPMQVQRQLDYSGAPQMGQSVGGSQDYYGQAGDALYRQQTRRLDDRMGRQQAALETQLLNQGFTRGDEGWNQAMKDFETTRNDAYEGANLAAIAGAGQEAGRLQGMDLSQGQYQNQLRQLGTSEADRMAQFYNSATGQQFGQNLQAGQFYNQAQQAGFGQDLAGQQFQQQLHQGGMQDAAQMGAFQNQAAQQAFNQDLQSSQYDTTRRQQAVAEEMQARGWSLNEINALLSGQQVGMPQMPGFSNAGVAQAPNYLGAAQAQGQYGLDAAQMQNQFMGDIFGGATSLLGGLVPFGFGGK